MICEVRSSNGEIKVDGDTEIVLRHVTLSDIAAFIDVFFHTEKEIVFRNPHIPLEGGAE